MGKNLDRKLRKATYRRTICEVMRKVNDLCQTDSEKDVQIRAHLREMLIMAKRMITKLVKYKRGCDADWWESIPAKEQKKLNKIRRQAGYKI